MNEWINLTLNKQRIEVMSVDSLHTFWFSIEHWDFQSVIFAEWDEADSHYEGAEGLIVQYDTNSEGFHSDIYYVTD